MVKRELSTIEEWPAVRRFVVADKKERQALLKKAKRQGVTSYRWFNLGDEIALYTPEFEAAAASLPPGEIINDTDTLKMAVAQDALRPAQSFEAAIEKGIDTLPEQPFLVGRCDTTGGDRSGELLPFSGARKTRKKISKPTSALGAVVSDQDIVAVYPKAISADEAKSIADAKHDASVFGLYSRELLVEGAPVITAEGKKPAAGGLIMTEDLRTTLPDLLQLSEDALAAWPAILTALFALIADRATLPRKNQIFLSEKQRSYLNKLESDFEAFFDAGGCADKLVPRRTRRRSATAA